MFKIAKYTYKGELHIFGKFFAVLTLNITLALYYIEDGVELTTTLVGQVDSSRHLHILNIEAK